MYAVIKSKDDIRANGNDFKSNAIFKLNGLTCHFN
jgi:hypothetical protein